MPGMYIVARSDPAPGIEVFILASTLEVRGFTGPLCALLPFLKPDLKPTVGRRANSFHFV